MTRVQSSGCQQESSTQAKGHQWIQYFVLKLTRLSNIWLVTLPLGHKVNLTISLEPLAKKCTYVTKGWELRDPEIRGQVQITSGDRTVTSPHM